MSHVFISYSRQNTDYAERLVDSLKAHGFDVWIDHRIEYGVNWSSEIFTAIRECAAFIVIMSPASHESKWVRREVAYADEIARPIFPILLEGEQWPLLLTMQHVDARDGNLPSPAFFERLREFVSRTADLLPENDDAMTTPIADSPTVQERRRKLETAVPACTPVGEESQLRVRISLPDSPGLAAELPDFIPAGDELHKSDVRATGFRMRFTPGETRLQDGVACVEVVSDDFDINSATTGEAPCSGSLVKLDVPPDADSRTVIFTLLPNANTPASGSARVYVRIYQDGVLVAESALATRMVANVDTHPACELWKMALANVAYDPPGLRRTDGGTFIPGPPPAPAPPALERAEDVLDRLIGGSETGESAGESAGEFADEYADLPTIGPAPESLRQQPPPPFPTTPPGTPPPDQRGWHQPQSSIDPDFEEFEPLPPVAPSSPPPFDPGKMYQGAQYGQYPGAQGGTQPPITPDNTPYRYPQSAPGIYAQARDKAQQNRVLWALVAVMGLQTVLIAVMALALLRRR